MIVLGIETSHDPCSVGLARDGQLMGEMLFCPGDRLLPTLESLLALHHLERRQIGLISVARGPGSFTSLRVGMAVGKGLAQALRIPIVGIPSMNAYAERVSKKICVVLPDRRDLVYYALYEGNRPITAEMSSTLRSLLEQLEQTPDLELCIGPGAERHRAELERFVAVAPAALNQPSGAVIAQLGALKYSQSQHDELWTLEPLYVQKTPPPSPPRPNPNPFPKGKGLPSPFRGGGGGEVGGWGVRSWVK
jgi:tRNA threonylcarbamoyladenosine biosynthesis protein TsaB